MKSAATINQHLQRSGRAGRESIRVVVMDGDRAVCQTEDTLDTWWANLSPFDKACLYEEAMGDGEERCKYCGCTETRACEGGCSWVDPNHTVCSAPACLRMHLAELSADVFGPNPPVEQPDGNAAAAAARWIEQTLPAWPSDRLRIQEVVLASV